MEVGHIARWRAAIALMEGDYCTDREWRDGGDTWAVGL
jgi:hypothetical protein